MFRKRQPEAPPEFMIVGLGNPGPEYRGTRHNVGFEVVEQLAEKNNIKLKSFRHQAQYGVGTIAGKVVILAKPLTYMNLSGSAVAALKKVFKIEPSQVLVITDDLDLPLSRLRLRAKGGSGGHKGHQSIIEALGTQEYPRLRIGISKGEAGIVDHVLSGFTPSQQLLVEKAIELASEISKVWLEQGLEKATQALTSAQKKGNL